VFLVVECFDDPNPIDSCLIMSWQHCSLALALSSPLVTNSRGYSGSMTMSFPRSWEHALWRCSNLDVCRF